jgi:ADP-dependent NAD(P)H-hydrate dehydratase / NAD(P)H-hydrate epimerase
VANSRVTKQVKARRPLHKSDHKYSRGVVAIIAGSKKYPGAGVLTVGGARRGGVGYVKFINKNSDATNLVLGNFPDVVPIDDLQNERVDALVVGPGATTIKSMPMKIPVVLDSGALALARSTKALRDSQQIVVVTPHEGELKSLGFSLAQDKESDISAHDKVSSVSARNKKSAFALKEARITTAQRVSDELNVITVLKGHRTVIAAPHCTPIIDTLGGPELAVAGSGDILAGLIGAFLASWKPVNFQEAQNTVAAAVHLHSQAGKHAARSHSVVVATDILESLAHC